MANRNFPASRQFGMHFMPVQLILNATIGASGAPTIVTGQGLGIASITRLVAGVYRIQLQDNYNTLLNVRGNVSSAVTGSNVAVTGITPGIVYQITVLGTTTAAGWVTAGLPAGITPAVGATFKAAATTTGTGQVKVLAASAITSIQPMSTPSTMLSNQPNTPLLGSFIDIMCVGPTDASTTTAIAQDPADGSTLSIVLLLNNSGVQ